MLPAKGMLPVHEMKLDEVWDKLRLGLGTMSKKHRGWAFALNNHLKAGTKADEWMENWARRVVIENRSPVIESYIDEDDNPEARRREADYAEF